jgi:trans-aconitate 2-methyltransferase
MMWDAALYDIRSRERRQPSADLAARLAGRTFGRILDVGCGTGLSTMILRERWPAAEITGVDLSVEMLNQARRTDDSVTWLQRDCSRPLDDLGRFDLVFSNAFLQWLSDQEEFLKNARELLAEDGVLAVQLPDFLSMPASDCILKAAETFPGAFDGIEHELFSNRDIEDYYDILKRYYSGAEVWRTGYYHVMDSHEAILEFIEGTALRPYLKRLDSGEAGIFQRKILHELKDRYDVREGGAILFEFKRMFFTARR